MTRQYVKTSTHAAHWGAVRAARSERAAIMATLYKDGKTLQEIGDAFGITRERVRQLISGIGVSALDGGQAVTAERARKRRESNRNQRYLRKYGCSLEQYKEVAEYGLRLRLETGSQYRDPRRAFCMQRRNAHDRGIGWEFNFYQWWSVWKESGKWGERGRGTGYVMCRIGDEGPYAPGNVFIATARENNSQTKNKKSGLPMGVHRFQKGAYVTFKAKKSVGGRAYNIGSFKTPELAHAAYLSFSPSDREATHS